MTKLYLLLILLCLPISIYSQTKFKTPRGEVADPTKFRSIALNGRAAAAATEPCSANLEECGSERIGLFGIDGLG